MFHRNLKTKQMDKREEFEDDPDGSIEKSGSVGICEMYPAFEFHEPLTCLAPLNFFC